MKIILLILISLSIFSCQKSIDLAHEKSLIQKVLQQERTFHFDNNVDGFISLMSDTIMSVKDGVVRKYSHDDMSARFIPYFGSVKFIKWDDEMPPVIEISDDGSMAYAVVKKEVLLTYDDTLGMPLYDTTHFAWMAIYRKFKGEWKGVANVSTEVAR